MIGNIYETFNENQIKTSTRNACYAQRISLHTLGLEHVSKYMSFMKL